MKCWILGAISKSLQRLGLVVTKTENIHETDGGSVTKVLPGWMPIETAPKDGTRVLLYVVHPGDEYAIAVGDPDGWRYIETGYWEGVWEHEHAGAPTHWMPLPEAPK